LRPGSLYRFMHSAVILSILFALRQAPLREGEHGEKEAFNPLCIEAGFYDKCYLLQDPQLSILFALRRGRNTII